MSNICIKVDDYVSPFAAQLPKIQTTDLFYVEKYETDAYGHWVFGSDTSSLVDKVNARTLTLQEGAVVQPTFGDNYVRLGAAKGQALLTNLNDDTNTQYTVSAVALPEDTALRILLGTLGGLEAPTGAGVFTSAGAAYLTIRPTGDSLKSEIVLEAGKPVFLSFSVNLTTGLVNLVAMQNNITYEKTLTRAQTAAGTPIALGNSRYATSASYNTLRNKFYEMIVHNRALTISEMKDVAFNVAERQRNRGVDF